MKFFMVLFALVGIGVMIFGVVDFFIMIKQHKDMLYALLVCGGIVFGGFVFFSISIGEGMAEINARKAQKLREQKEKKGN